jgi:hypothetical protein
MVGSAPSFSTAICVLGMHRSGTSAMAGLLSLHGVEFGRNLMKAGEDNPKGFFEHYEVVGCHISLLEALGSYYDDILPLPAGWERRPETVQHREFLRRLIFNEFAGKPLWGFKDPRACRLLPLWFPLFKELGSDPRFILMARNPDEIASSMFARGGHSFNQILLVTLEHLLTAERQTRGRRRAVVSYDRLVANWRDELERVGKVLDIGWPTPPGSANGRASTFVDPAMRHYSGVADAEGAVAVRGADPRVAEWVYAAHKLFLAAAVDGAGGIDEAALDAIAEDMRKSSLHLSAWRPPRSNKDRLVKMQLHASRLDGELQRLAKENQELRRRLST